MTDKLILPPGVKRARGESRWPLPDTLKLAKGALLRHSGEWVPIATTQGKIYRGPHDLTVIVSLDERGEPWGTLLHMSMSLPRGYPDWDQIYAVTRAVFGEDIDAMMPMPREEAFIHHAVKGQRHVFHVVEMPQAWQAEDAC
jgi:hypothetical protein